MHCRCIIMYTPSERARSSPRLSFSLILFLFFSLSSRLFFLFHFRFFRSFFSGRSVGIARSREEEDFVRWFEFDNQKYPPGLRSVGLPAKIIRIERRRCVIRDGRSQLKIILRKGAALLGDARASQGGQQKQTTLFALRYSILEIQETEASVLVKNRKYVS